MAPSSPQPDSEPEPTGSTGSPEQPSTAPEPSQTPDTKKPRSQNSATGAAPLIEDRRDTGGNKRRINPARMEVRLRRIALLGLILVPLVYFIVQSLR